MEWPSWLDIFWLVSTAGIGLTGLITITSPNFVFISDLVKYGVSASSQRSSFHRFIEVPKKWFTHFYITATLSSVWGLWWVVWVYVWGAEVPGELGAWLRWLGAPHARASLAEAGVALAALLLCLHALRRLLESLFVSVYSDTRMNLLHYLLGHLHYAALPLAILAEAPEFTARGWLGSSRRALHLGALSWLQLGGLALYLYASYQQHAVFQGLASLRRGHTGNITTYAHGIVYGGWHDLVSCPHFFFEILIYCSFHCVLNGANVTWHYVLLFVLLNQELTEKAEKERRLTGEGRGVGIEVVAGLITHNWYKERFGKSYPVERHAVIPYVI